jgi:hypothetical protein
LKFRGEILVVADVSRRGHTFHMDILLPAHVLVSLIGIASGVVILFGFFHSNRLDGWTALFMATTAATSASGFLFPIHGVTPGIVVGIISLVVLAIATIARYALHMAGAWRKIYVITAMIALYLNCFVLIAQLFRRVPFLTALAPTQSEPPFAVAQGVLLLAFVILTIMAASRFRTPIPAV